MYEPYIAAIKSWEEQGLSPFTLYDALEIYALRKWGAKYSLTHDVYGGEPCAVQVGLSQKLEAFEKRTND